MLATYRLSSLAALLVIAGEVTSSHAHAQNYRWTTTTDSSESYRRPPVFEPFFQFGDASLTVTIVGGVQVTNTSPNPYFYLPELLRVEEFIKGGECWGSDPSSMWPHSFGIAGATIAPGATRQFSGTQVLQYSTNVRTCSNTTGEPDGIHTGNVFWGPTFGDWYGVGGSDVTSLGVHYTHELAISTTYDLPTIPGSTTNCYPLVANSTGATGSLRAYGIAEMPSAAVLLVGSNLPANQFALGLISEGQQPAIIVGSGSLTLCLGWPVHRLLSTITSTGSGRNLEQFLELDGLPIPGGTISAGSTWFYQFIYRDQINGVSTVNSTNSVRVDFL